MRFQSRKAVSVIIATLLLIAITVAAGIIVYVFVNGLAGNLTSGGGQQTTERLQMQSYNFVISPAGANPCSCSGQLAELFLLNSGSSTTTISAVYYDGSLQTTLAPGAASNTLPTTLTTYYDSTAAYITTATLNGDFQFSAAPPAGQLTVAAGGTVQIVVTLSTANAAVAGTSHTIKVVSTTGATYVFAVTAGRSG